MNEAPSPRFLGTHLHPDNMPASFNEKKTKDLSTGIHQISSFIGFSLTDNQVQQIAGASTFSAMKESSVNSHGNMGNGRLETGRTILLQNRAERWTTLSTNTWQERSWEPNWTTSVTVSRKKRWKEEQQEGSDGEEELQGLKKASTRNYEFNYGFTLNLNRLLVPDRRSSGHYSYYSTRENKDKGNIWL
ncbi:hypothetical protein GOODEAATRI_020945 [Goodea atripinnis]|uniref:Uncharacterized protein n=1 Tax=Goodea atripinnis TaxID=208336 RepID=A0ABV0N341_9TELE